VIQVQFLFKSKSKRGGKSPRSWSLK